MWLHPLQPLPPQYPNVVLYLDRKKTAFATKPRAQPDADASPAGAQHPGRNLGGRVVGGCLQERAHGWGLWRGGRESEACVRVGVRSWGGIGYFARECLRAFVIVVAVAVDRFVSFRFRFLAWLRSRPSCLGICFPAHRSPYHLCRRVWQSVNQLIRLFLLLPSISLFVISLSLFPFSYFNLPILLCML